MSDAEVVIPGTRGRKARVTTTSSGTPGLVITDLYDGRWTIVHPGSGRAMGSARTLTGAVAMADAYAVAAHRVGLSWEHDTIQTIMSDVRTRDAVTTATRAHRDH